MGPEGRFNAIPVKTIDQMKGEVSDMLVDAYGSVEEAEKYAGMELSPGVMSPNRDSGVEENLADKISYARSCIDLMNGLQNANAGETQRLNETLTSIRTSGKRNFK